jgi:hypothetical protein
MCIVDIRFEKITRASRHSTGRVRAQVYSTHLAKLCKCVKFDSNVIGPCRLAFLSRCLGLARDDLIKRLIRMPSLLLYEDLCCLFYAMIAILNFPSLGVVTVE